jgi:MoaA/NifB/PqqE/SkfB family radical SAM enzyme
MLNSFFSFRKIKAWVLNLKGIAGGFYAYKGPDLVQIDCTDRCNSRCLACWTHSPLIKNSRETIFEELEPAKVKDFIKELKKNGIREICFSGGGEPFLYRGIWEVLDFTQQAGIPFCINTNLTLLNEDGISRLLKYDKLRSLTVSIWAPEPGLYSMMHGRDEKSFDEVKNNLKFLNRRKHPGLDVVICSVMTNLNYSCMKELASLAAETGCGGIEFALVDVIPGATDRLLLNADQLCCLKKDISDLAKKGIPGGKVNVVNKRLFLRRLLSPGAAFGEYDIETARKPCYAGWIFLRLRANGDFNSCRKSHRFPIGNIYQESFSSIWNNALQKEFREKGARLPKDREFFKRFGNGCDEGIGCRRSCDNALLNEHAYQIAKFLIRTRNYEKS